MTRERPECSIVVRAFNEERHLDRLFDGIEQQTVRDVEVVVVDSGSTDATPALAGRRGARVVAVAPEQFSFGRSLNVGCGATVAPVIVVASAHVFPVFKDWLERLIAPFAHPDVALVYGRQRGGETTRYSEHQVFTQWFGELSNPAQDHPFCNNANASIRRSVWERVPYDEGLTGLEDIAWAKAVRALGMRVWYEATAEVVHLHDETPARVFNRYRREALALRQIFPEERFSLRAFVRLFAGNVSSDLYHAAHDRVMWRNVRWIVLFRLMQLWGTYRGFTQRRPASGRLLRTFYYPRTRARRLGPSGSSEARGRVEYAGPTARRGDRPADPPRGA